MSLEFSTDISDLLKGIYMIDKKADLAVKMLADTNAKVMVWNDLTNLTPVCSVEELN